MERTANRAGHGPSGGAAVDVVDASFALSAAPVPWRAVWGTVLTTGVAFGIGLATGHLAWGTWAFLGGFTSFYVADQPYGARARVLSGVLVGLAIAVAVGSADAVWWAMAAAFGGIAFGATYLSGWFRLPLPAGFMFILVASVSAATPTAGQLPQRVALALAGGAVAWVVGMAGAVLRPSAPQAQRVANAYAALAAFVTADGIERATVAEHRAAAAVRKASATPPASGPGGTRLAILAQRAEPILWAAVALRGERGGRLSDGFGAYLRRLGGDPGAPAARAGPPPAAGGGQLARRFARVVAETARAATRPRPVAAAGAAVAEWPRGSAPPFLWHAALRTAIAVALAVALAHAIGVKHPYWLPLTVAAVLQGHTVEMLTRRAVQRVAGTVGGVVLAAALIAGLHPSPLADLALVVVLQAAMRILMVKNYGLAVVPMTSFALLIIHASTAVPAPPLALSRLGDSILGVTLALAATFVLWPRASSRHLPHALAATVRAEAALFRSAAARTGGGAGAAARSVQACLSRLYATAADALSELPRSERAARLWPAVLSTTRLGYLLVAADRSALELGADDATVAQVEAVMADLARSAEGHAGPTPPRPLPDVGAVGRELVTLARALLA